MKPLAITFSLKQSSSTIIFILICEVNYVFLQAGTHSRNQSLTKPTGTKMVVKEPLKYRTEWNYSWSLTEWLGSLWGIRVKSHHKQPEVLQATNKGGGLPGAPHLLLTMLMSLIGNTQLIPPKQQGRETNKERKGG